MSKDKVKEPEYILVTDVGSTTSKARFFQKKGKEYRYVVSGEAPTTVEAPFEDVRVGTRNAIREIEELTGHKLLSADGSILTRKGKEKAGVDIYCTTSSAGGGLQMTVSGLVKKMTGESAERAALTAGAIIMDIFAIDDGYKVHERIRRIRTLRPDMVLMAGGTDKGNVKDVIDMAELLSTAAPKPRLGSDFKLPVVYAGNRSARPQIKNLLDKNFALKIIDNIRPTLEVEDTTAARDAVHELFMEHVMSHAPGYDELMKWTDIPIMPTPGAEGMMIRVLAETNEINALGVGLGGATTNIYSIYDGRFVRSVSANLGMSYSICNVLKNTGLKNIIRWLPFEVNEAEVQNRLHNKMIRPTTLPQTVIDLMVEHAVAREALRLGFEHHKLLARHLRGGQREERIQITSEDMETRIKIGLETYIKMINVSMIVGTGGLLSHAPRRVQAALMLSDGFRPAGITQLAVDSVFMIPHCGVLSTVHRKSAMDVFEKDCLVRLGTSITSVGAGKEGEDAVTVKAKMPDGKMIEETIPYGTIKAYPLKADEKAEIQIKPAKNFDVGEGEGKTIETTVTGGVVGIIMDARGRPLILPEEAAERKQKLLGWFKSLDAYPPKILKKLGEI